MALTKRSCPRSQPRSPRSPDNRGHVDRVPPVSTAWTMRTRPRPARRQRSPIAVGTAPRRDRRTCRRRPGRSCDDARHGPPRVRARQQQARCGARSPSHRAPRAAGCARSGEVTKRIPRNSITAPADEEERAHVASVRRTSAAPTTAGRTQPARLEHDPVAAGGDGVSRRARGSRTALAR